jgi:hypothetical protein
MYDVRERDVPEQLVVSEQRHVLVPELPEWIGAAGTRQIAMAEERGAPAGPMFAIYHGEVNEESDGRVEVCVPVREDVRDGSDAAVRREPAHPEAHVRITKADGAVPQTLAAYEAVEQWLRAEGRNAAGAPREVYFADWDASAPMDEVCDVAFPVS